MTVDVCIVRRNRVERRLGPGNAEAKGAPARTKNARVPPSSIFRRGLALGFSSGTAPAPGVFCRAYDGAVLQVGVGRSRSGPSTGGFARSSQIPVIERKNDSRP